MLCVHKLLLLEWHTLSITYATGSKYGGDWENNERHGKGVMTTVDKMEQLSMTVRGMKVKSFLP